MKNKFNSLCMPVLLLVVLLGAGGCATSPPPLPQSKWGGQYPFSYHPTGEAKPANSVPITIAVVNPDYKVGDSILNTQLYHDVGEGFSASMGSDLDSILVTKGMTVTGPFPSLNEMTYSDKKVADLTLTPEVFITRQVQYLTSSERLYRLSADFLNPQLDTWRVDLPFMMNVKGWIEFSMQEPLSGEKMWIKKLQPNPVTVQGIISYEAFGVNFPQIRNLYTPGNKLLFDGAPDAMADALKQLYPDIMSSFEKYIESDEMVALKKQVNEIRASNRFLSN